MHAANDPAVLLSVHCAAKSEFENNPEMKKVAFCLIALVVFADSAFADQLVMKNGDRITGKIVSQTDGKIAIETDYAGTVTVVADKVASVKIDDSAPTVPVNPIKASTTTVAVAKTTEPAVAPAAKTPDVPEKKEERNFLPRPLRKAATGWEGNANVGFSYTSGNSRTSTFTAGVRAERTTTRDKWTAYLKGLVNRNRVTGTNVTTSNAMWGGIRYDRNFSKRMFVFGTYDFERDKPQKLNFRSVLGAGIGDHLVKRDRTEIDLLAGAAWNRTWRVGSNDTTIAEALFGNTLKHKFSDRLKFQQGFTIYPSLINAGRYRFVLDATLSADVTKRIGMFVTIADRFNSFPLSNVRRNDFLFTTGLKWGFGKKRK